MEEIGGVDRSDAAIATSPAGDVVAMAASLQKLDVRDEDRFAELQKLLDELSACVYDPLLGISVDITRAIDEVTSNSVRLAVFTYGPQAAEPGFECDENISNIGRYLDSLRSDLDTDDSDRYVERLFKEVTDSTCNLIDKLMEDAVEHSTFRSASQADRRAFVRACVEMWRCAHERAPEFVYADMWKLNNLFVDMRQAGFGDVDEMKRALEIIHAINRLFARVVKKNEGRSDPRTADDLQGNLDILRDAVGKLISHVCEDLVHAIDEVTRSDQQLAGVTGSDDKEMIAETKDELKHIRVNLTVYDFSDRVNRLFRAAEYSNSCVDKLLGIAGYKDDARLKYRYRFAEDCVDMYRLSNMQAAEFNIEHASRLQSLYDILCCTHFKGACVLDEVREALCDVQSLVGYTMW